MQQPIAGTLILHDYQEAREKFLIALEGKHKDLAKYAGKKEASQWVIDKGNKELKEAYEFVQQVENFMHDMHGVAKREYLEKKIVLLKKSLHL